MRHGVTVTTRVVLGAPTAAYPQHDTASVAVLPGGALLAAWRRVRGHAAGATSEIVTARSQDGGRTWSTPRCQVRQSPDDVRVQAPAIAVTGDGLLASCLHWHADGTTSQSLWGAGCGDARWAPRGHVWRRAAEQWRQGGASSIVRLACGRLLLPVQGGGGYGTARGERCRAACLRSDDGGRTWQWSASQLALPGRGAMEPSVAERGDGTLVMALRTQLGRVHLSESADGGVTWSPPRPSELRAPESCACLRPLRGGAALLLVYNDAPYDPRAAHCGPRTPLSAAVSTDGGRTWPRRGDLASGGLALTNPDAVEAPDGTVLVTYTARYRPGAGERSAVRLLRIPREVLGRGAVR